jgi:hypothetical protein
VRKTQVKRIDVKLIGLGGMHWRIINYYENIPENNLIIYTVH